MRGVRAVRWLVKTRAVATRISSKCENQNILNVARRGMMDAVGVGILTCLQFEAEQPWTLEQLVAVP